MKTPMEVRQRVESVLARIFLVLLSMLFTFWGIEMVSRRFITTRSPVEDRLPVNKVRHLKPYVMIGAEPHERDFNELGYRSGMPKIPKEPGEFRIFMLGGSTVLLGDPPISGILEAIFEKDDYPNVKVYNYGVLSSVSGMELARIVFEISELQADLVVMYNGGNDIIVPWESDPRPGYPFNFLVFENNPLVESTPESYPAFSLFAYGSNIFRYAFRDYFIEHFVHLEDLRKKTGYLTEPWKEKIANVYVSNMCKANHVSEAFGSDFIVFFQPLVFYKKTLSPEEQLEPEDAVQAKYARDMRELILSRMKQASENGKLNWQDLSSIYDDKRGHVFTDIIHTNAKGRKVVAAAIHEEIQKRFGSKIIENSKSTGEKIASLRDDSSTQ